MALKPSQKTIRIPEELLPLIEARMEKEGYRSLSDYVLALSLYDCWCEREHKVTAPIFAKPQRARDKVLAQVIEEFHTKKKTGRANDASWFDKRVRELAEEIAKAKMIQPPNGPETTSPGS